MADKRGFCEQNWKVWVAFMMGMVIVVVAIVFFDRTLEGGRPGDAPRPVEEGIGREDYVVGQSASFLSLRDGRNGRGAWLGIEAVNVTGETAAMLGHAASGGVLVSKVLKSSPAEAAGLQNGDILYELDYRGVESVEDLSALLGRLSPDARVKVVLRRDGGREVVYVKLGEVTGANASLAVSWVAGEVVPNDQKWGIAVSELTESLRKTYGIPKKEEGVAVVMVLPGSAADRAGLKAGDLVQQVDSTEVRGLADFFEVLQSSANRILLRIYRDGAVLLVQVVAASPFMPVGGRPDTDDDDDDEGLKGRPAQIPPMGKPESAAIEKGQGVVGTLAGAAALTGGSEDDDEPPVCKRIQEIENML
jgi:membrane-associated protease RseP (regulator of RpoE activity)